MSVKQRSRDGWQYADINLNGVRKKIALGTKDPKEGTKLIRRIKADITLGKFNTQSTLQKTATLLNFFQSFFEYISSYMQPATVRNTRLYAKSFMDFVGRNLELRKINAEQLDRWKVHILSRYSPATYNIMWRTLHAAFNVARRWNYVEVNPFSGITKVKVEQKRRYLTWHELQMIIAFHDQDIADPKKRHLRAFFKKFRLLIEFLVLTGMRRQEALSLRISQVDMRSGVLFVEKTKSKTYRTLPMHPRVKEIVGELGDKLFNGMDPSSVSHRFARLVARAGLDDSFKLHSLRHTFATNLVSKGVDIAVIQNLLGHSDIRTTLIYGKTTVETMKNDILKLDRPV